MGAEGLGPGPLAALEKLQKLDGAVSRVARGVGKGDLPTVQLSHGSGATCEVYLHGATVARYAVNGKERLWVSESAVFDGARAIRGGVPVVFPVFGPDRDGVMKQHGFARTATWSMASAAVDESGSCVCVLTLADDDATRALWPHAFSLEYTVTLDGDSLAMSLAIKNTGDAPFTPQCLLHTYLATADSARVMVHGLEGATYVDKLAESAKVEESAPAIRFKGETDRIYLGATRPLCPLTVRPGGRVDCHACVLEVDGTIAAEFAPDCVVWNPHVAKAAAMGDFDDDGWKTMLCVEPGVVAADRPVIAPGRSLVLAQTITPEA